MHWLVRVAGVAIAFFFWFLVFASPDVELRRSLGRVGAMYFPHGHRPPPGEPLGCQIWFPPPEFSSIIALDSAQSRTTPVGAYGAMIIDLRNRAGCPWSTWDGPTAKSLIATVGTLALIIFVRAVSTRLRSRRRTAAR